MWKLLERFGVQGMSFVLQIILARILSPNEYGILALMIIFTTLANVFIQNGFNTALIQNKDVIEDDYSSVFWVSFIIAIMLYIFLYFSAPWIGSFYHLTSIVTPFRVLSIMILPGALNSIQIAKISREMDFKKVFICNICATVIAGTISILVALNGGGIWALVIQILLNTIISCILMLLIVKWKPRFVCNLKRVKKLFSYGWKLLVSSLIDTLYQELQSLIVGKKYNSDILGVYDRGKHFPQFIMNAVNGSVQSVMLPAMSEKQEVRMEVKELMRKSIAITSYIVFPMMAGLAGIANPLVTLLLTEKWLSCVPYLQIYCFCFAFYPIHSCNLQAINAMGRSDLFLKLEIIKKTYGFICLMIAVLCFDSPLAIAMTGLVTAWLSWFVNAYPNKKLLGYTFKEQIVDIIPSLLISSIMAVIVLVVGRLEVNKLIGLGIQIIVGIFIYISLSVIVKPQAFIILRNRIIDFRRKK